jgi:copper chaperone CopZ
MENVTYKVAGLNCGHCANSVEEALKSLDSVSEAKVELETQTVTISVQTELADDDVQKAVVDAGYQFSGRIEG